MNSPRHHFTTHFTSNASGILWMILAGVFFSFMVGLIKLLGSRIPSYEIVFFRSAIQLLFLTGVYCRLGFSSLKTDQPLLQGVRTLLAVLLINCNFYAFTQLPVAEVTAIGFSRSLFLALLAVPFLAEKFTRYKIVALFLGFIGVLLITKPGPGTFQGVMLIALAGAALGATMMILIRKLTATDSNIAMMTYPALGIVFFTSIPTIMFWIQPSTHELILLLAMAVMGIIGQWCMIQAFRLGEATAVAPAEYARIIFATIIGYWVFAELPDASSLLGIVIVIGSNLLLIYKEGRVSKTEPGVRVPGDVT
jgi:drug/metabolite transporter (DMT)-like permease